MIIFSKYNYLAVHFDGFELIMKNLFWICFVLLAGNVVAQDYFQQNVDYKITVTLDDQNKMLRGFEEFKYQNNSPNELEFIYIHLWPNAYKNNKTALAKQLYVGMNNSELEFATEEALGFIDSLDFYVDGVKAQWELDADNIDIAKLFLPKGLISGKSIKVSTPFRVKIPSGEISRLGYVGESFQITQWYPKPAVYDKNGWHQMPYLTQGEFYSEFGSFDVSITLPKNYIVGATGDLQTESEITFLSDLALKTKEKYGTDNAQILAGIKTPFPPSSEEMKTIRFKQDKVHDFAWFADKRFEVLKGEVKMPKSGKIVNSWAMFVPNNAALWVNAIEYINDATYYYSKWNGDYPYNNVTAVDGTISAGGGMEYPTITVIGNASNKEELELVIVHEVGHNWFYGLMASNERDHAWMDEGLNTLNEIRYFETKYPKNTRMTDMFSGMGDFVHLNNLSHHDMAYLSYAMVAGIGLDQPIELGSSEYTNLNYGAIVYSKTGLVFTYLKDYLGEELFDKCMQAYFEAYKYKHPQPEDLRAILEKHSKKNLNWLFDDLIQTTKQIDFKIAGVKIVDDKTIVSIRNTGQINCPVRVDAFSNSVYRESKWLEPGDKVQDAIFDGITYDAFIIDANKQMPEINRNNNYWSKKGVFHRIEPLKMELIGGDNEADKWNAFWMPAIGFNAYDVFMIGAVFHNQTIPKNKFEYTIAPLYSINRKNIAGFADMNYSWTPSKNIRMITLGAKSKIFGNGLGTPSEPGKDPIGSYLTVQPYLQFKIGKPNNRTFYKQNLDFRGNYSLEAASLFNSELVGGTMKYQFAYNKARHGVNFNVQFDYMDVKSRIGITSYQSELLNMGVEGRYKFTYWKKKKKEIELRAFLGKNLFYQGDKNTRYGFSLGGQSGTQDVNYDNYMFGRNEQNGIWTNQRIDNQGGFKTTSSYGTSTNMIFAANLYSELPFIPLLGVFSDWGVFDQNGTLITVADFGVGIRFADRFGIYFPLIESTNLKSAFGSTNYGEKIRFSLKLEGFNLREIFSGVL